MKKIAIVNHLMDFILTISLSSDSMFRMCCPPRSPNYQWPMVIYPLLRMFSSICFSSSEVRISPAVFLQLVFLSSYFMASILACSFVRSSLALTISPANLVSCCFI